METIQPASVSRQPVHNPHGYGAIVFDPTRLRQATPALTLFDPASYGTQARLVQAQAQGGRGAAWFVQGTFGEAVLRHYRRGGWMARLSEDAYIWQGEAATRSFREFFLLAQLCRVGLPVPTPYAAMYIRRGFFYRASILIECIAQAQSFAELVSANPTQAPWEAVGLAIARCHRHYAHHADLNAHNILVTRAGSIYLIDWDKGRIETAIGAWCENVLNRLERSLHKQCQNLPTESIRQGMKILRQAHQQELNP